jgi:hypothetical protein
LLDAIPEYIRQADLYRGIIRPVKLATSFKEVFQPVPEEADGQQ